VLDVIYRCSGLERFPLVIDHGPVPDCGGMVVEVGRELAPVELECWFFYPPVEPHELGVVAFDQFDGAREPVVEECLVGLGAFRFGRAIKVRPLRISHVAVEPGAG
jgi:hypothetical protein